VKQKHNREDHISLITRAIYNPTASIKCPRWIQFIDEIFSSDKETIDFIERAVGYSITGETKESVFFMLVGEGANGKSLFLNTLAHVLGDYARTCNPDVFVRSRFAAQKEQERALVSLIGARFVIAPETGLGQQIDAPALKRFTGGEDINVRKLYREEFSFRSEAKLWFATNERPQINDSTDALWRRLRLVEMKEQFPINTNLPDELLKEKAGILKWCVECARKYYKEGLGVPPKMEADIFNYRSEEDVLQSFIRDCCEVDKRNREMRVSVSNLYEAFRQWEGATGYSPYSKIFFGKKLRRLGYYKKRYAAGIFWHGIRLVGE
jgi:putative DNA primase/helicase